MSERPDPGKRVPSGSIGELFQYLMPECMQSGAMPFWPPDVFALTAKVLHATGVYLYVLELNGDLNSPLRNKAWPEEASRLGGQWRGAINDAIPIRLRAHKAAAEKKGSLDKISLPAEITRLWAICMTHADCSINDLVENATQAQYWDLCCALVKLTIIADEASAGIGVRNTMQGEPDPFLGFAEKMLGDSGGRSLCRKIDCNKVRVLPKQHTPQRGMTLRSLTHHLAWCPGGEVNARWTLPLATHGRSFDILNLLLLPWPLTIPASAFGPRLPGDYGFDAAPTHARFFDYQPDPQPENLRIWLQQAIKDARVSAQNIDVIIFPEAALTREEYGVAESVAFAEGAMLIAGLMESEAENQPPRNLCCMHPGGVIPSLEQFRKSAGSRGLAALDGLRVEQSKHHRWCLDRNQILQYRLGGRLPASKECWELISLGKRELNFVTLQNWLTLSVLICEDLAQQDPVAEILRAVGPTLLVALLMDGPQLSNRWPSRYASVLADDPGTSVLTFTSLGMAQRSQPRHGETSRSRTIGLWRDSHFGERELELEKGHDAAVLSLVSQTAEEFTADGRGDGSKAFFPVFAGLNSFKVSDACGPGVPGAGT